MSIMLIINCIVIILILVGFTVYNRKYTKQAKQTEERINQMDEESRKDYFIKRDKKRKKRVIIFGIVMVAIIGSSICINIIEEKEKISNAKEEQLKEIKEIETKLIGTWKCDSKQGMVENEGGKGSGLTNYHITEEIVFAKDHKFTYTTTLDFEISNKDYKAVAKVSGNYKTEMNYSYKMVRERKHKRGKEKKVKKKYFDGLKIIYEYNPDNYVFTMDRNAFDSDDAYNAALNDFKIYVLKNVINNGVITNRHEYDYLIPDKLFFKQ